MTFLAILVWLVIVAGTVYMLKTLIFSRDGEACCPMASGGTSGEADASKTFSGDLPPKEEVVKEEAAEKEIPQEEPPKEETIEESEDKKKSEGEDK